MTRAQQIAAELSEHGTQADGRCACGHEYRAGDSIAAHRADAIDAALTLHTAGVPDTAVHEAVTAVLALTHPPTPTHPNHP
jgi:hypothetical protein